MKDVTGSEVLSLQKEGKKILLDLWAPWCGPCRMLIPRLTELSTQYDNVEFVKVNVDENMEFAQAMGVRGVPTVVFFNGNDEKGRFVGVKSDSDYKEILDNL